MKRILLEIENYLSYFWVSFSILFAMAAYLMWRLPIFIWFGANHQTNFFGSSLYETENFYPLILFHALLPLAIIFLALSLFIWLYYRSDKIVSKIGFKNILISVFAIFLLFLLPIQAYFTSQKVREYKDRQTEEFAQSKKGHVKSPPSSFEIYKLYQSLADDGIQAWRTDPLAVAQSAIKEGGALHRFSRPDNEFVLQSKFLDDNTGRWIAVVELKNNYYNVEIILRKHLQQDESGIWLVKKYIKKK
ncbi:MAG: hypothetical protein U9R14_02355 [Patescibacteria group bacterium]|nr:hypothetical protein [Patescibacteria group bacterium]